MEQIWLYSQQQGSQFSYGSKVSNWTNGMNKVANEVDVDSCGLRRSCKISGFASSKRDLGSLPHMTHEFQHVYLSATSVRFRYEV